MAGTLTQRITRPAALAAALTVPWLLPSAPGAALAAPPDDTIWMRVEVNGHGEKDARIKINLPLSLIEVVVDSIDKRQFMVDLEDDHPHLDIARLWRDIRRLRIDEFVTIESEEASIRVWKDRDFFRVNVREKEYDEPNIEVQVPLEVMDLLFEPRSDGFDLQELVERVRPHLPLTLVQAQNEDKSVRIWLEQQ